MDPVTHALIGGAIYKLSGGQISISDPQFTAIVAGAMAPDLDIVIKRWGQLLYQKNHRGITHSFFGLVGLSLAIAASCVLIYANTSFLNVFLYAFIGCISHSAADILNSYGTRLLWPFFKKKIALNVLILFDPLIFIGLIGIILSSRNIGLVIAGAILIYTAFRIAYKLVLRKWLSEKYHVKLTKVRVLPSVANLLKWHFIIKFDNYSIVGYKTLFKSDIFIIRRFYHIDNKIRQKAMDTKVGRFFEDFAPIYDVQHDVVNGRNVFTFTDIRHYLSGNFVHHAFVTFSENYVLKEQIFCPYSLNHKIYL